MPADVDPDLPGRDDPHRLDVAAVAVVFIGGCAGGLVRYLVTRDWPANVHQLPWSVVIVNTAGACVLAVVASLAIERGWRLRRLLVGTGFCGALTTFSTVVVGADELVAHDRTGLAAAYVLLTIAAALLAAVLGIAVTRRVIAFRA